VKCHMTLAGPSATCLLADKHQVQTNAFALILLYANYIACLYFISNELFSKQTNIFKQRQNHSWGEFSSKVPIERVECTKKVEDHWCRVRFLFCHRTKSFLMIEKNLVNSVTMSENIEQCILLQQVSILLWDKWPKHLWPKCLGTGISPESEKKYRV